MLGWWCRVLLGTGQGGSPLDYTRLWDRYEAGERIRAPTPLASPAPPRPAARRSLRFKLGLGRRLQPGGRVSLAPGHLGPPARGWLGAAMSPCISWAVLGGWCWCRLPGWDELLGPPLLPPLTSAASVTLALGRSHSYTPPPPALTPILGQDTSCP